MDLTKVIQLLGSPPGPRWKKTGTYTRQYLSYLLSGPRRLFDKVDYPSPRYLGQQASNAISHILLRHTYDLGADRTRLPELDQEAIDVHPLLKVRFIDCLPDVAKKPSTDHVVRYVDCDLSEVLMLGCDGLECPDDPSGTPRVGPKYHIFKLCRFREVYRSRRRRLT